MGAVIIQSAILQKKHRVVIYQTLSQVTGQLPK